MGPFAPSVLRFRGRLIQDLIREGYEVMALAPDFGPEHNQQLKAWRAVPRTYPLDRHGTNPWKDLQTLGALARIFQKEKPKIVLGYHPKPAAYAPFAAWLAGVPIRIAWIGGVGYAFMNGSPSWKRRTVRLFQTLWYRISFSVAQQVWFQNPDDREAFVRKGIVSPEKAVVVGGTGVDLQAWTPEPPHLQPLTFTLVARLLREKGVREFVEAAKMIKARYPETRFWLIGPLDTNPGAIPEHAVRQWVEEGIVEWVPWTDDVRAYLRKTSVFVLPSYREGVPRSTQEALATARPVITTDVPGCRETVMDGVNGFLVPPRGPKALAEAMERFIQEPELITTMGQESRRLAEERFDVHKINQRLIQYISEIQKKK